ncbi:ParA family protein [Stenotrophobium rhamnosiphilum]|uniref:Chromosome partitioning protein ParA n=1 Tax=Stenotrophobium rhamnosiphilum TaxID=2029166 RepID=A0A2T5MFM6_9GAMM|nr:AAA family ATPase [Stenotrophobium rhamnosiphilum]PTU31374.1 chromosome partitioning protein ParA [Stenotrophobium rhamnosiphilum]
MQTLALYNLKGGVGKSAAAVNLAYLAAADGYSTLLWDLDPQAAATWYFDIKTEDGKTKKVVEGNTPIGRLAKPTPYDNLGVIPADFSSRYLDIMLKKVVPPREALKRLLKPFGEQYSLIVLDCAPSISHLADNVFTAADLVLAPVVPTFLSLRALEQVQEYFKQEGYENSALRPFYSMADRRRGLHRDLLENRPKSMARSLETVVPYSSTVERMGEHRAPIPAFAPSDDAALIAYAELWLETKKLLKF